MKVYLKANRKEQVERKDYMITARVEAWGGRQGPSRSWARAPP